MYNISRKNKKQIKTEPTNGEKVNIYIPDIIIVVLGSLVFGQQKKKVKNKQKKERKKF